MRALLVALVLALPGGAVGAQDLAIPGSPVVTLDQERLFNGSRFGRAVIARNEADERALAAEFRQIEAALEEEERSLTERRPGLPPEEFRKLADEFDLRVEAVRRAQDGRSRALVRRRDEDRKVFIERVLPVLGRLMGERGAVAILNSEAIVLSFDRIDITDAAIARLDAEFGDGEVAPPPPTDPEVGPSLDAAP